MHTHDVTDQSALGRGGAGGLHLMSDCVAVNLCGWQMWVAAQENMSLDCVPARQSFVLAAATGVSARPLAACL